MILISVATVILMIGLAVNPFIYTAAVLDGVTIWGTKVLPAMLPYFILTKFLTNQGCVPSVSKLLSPLTDKLYRVPGAGGYAYLMSVISGYPIGARVTLDLVQIGAIDSSQATRISTFTSTSGPLFILGTVSSMFGSYRMGLIILAAHLIASALNGLLYRNTGKNTVVSSVPLKPIKEDAVVSSVLSVLTVGGYIAIFFVLATFLDRIHALDPLYALFGTLSTSMGLPPEFAQGLVSGLLEITKGCNELSAFATQHPLAVTTAACGMISFGGLCIQMQGWSYLKQAGVKAKIFFASKFTQALIATLIAWLIGSIAL